MSRTAARIAVAMLDMVNALQPARQRGKTVANVMATLEERAARTVQTTHGLLTFLTSRGRQVAGATDNFFGNEPETLAWIDSLPVGARLWDIGGAFGQFSLYAGRRGLKVTAFEPKATSYGLLVEHIALNGLGDNVTALNLALSDKTGMTALLLAGIDAGGALNTLDGSTDQFGQVPSAFRQPVYAARMDDVCSIYGVEPPEHIKLDVDGIEEWILRGGPETLKGVNSLMIEVEGELLAIADTKVADMMTAAGLFEDVSVREQGSKRNRLFRRKD
jgi:FkbM family methyltransferase